MPGKYFRVKYDNEYTDLKEIKVRVPPGSVLGPIHYFIYTSDLPQPKSATLTTFVDDKAILVVENDVETATKRLQNAVNAINKCIKKWKIKLNKTKLTHINITNEKIKPFSLKLNKGIIPYANTAKYLRMKPNAKLR